MTGPAAVIKPKEVKLSTPHLTKSRTMVQENREKSRPQAGTRCASLLSPTSNNTCQQLHESCFSVGPKLFQMTDIARVTHGISLTVRIRDFTIVVRV